MSTDLLLGLLKLIVKKRDLKVVVMSATMDAEKFQKYFFNAPLLDVPGRMHPVEMYYSPNPEENYLEAAIRTAVQIHCYEDPGDILVFLTGEEEIEQACAQIREEVDQLGEEIPLYSTLPPKQQQRIFDPAPPANKKGIAGRKCIVSTNVAETSLTIDGIVYVVDPGFSKQKVYNPRSRVESLLVSQISKASAKQRSGRAGRTRMGKCFRLYTEESYNKELPESSYPEILISNLTNMVITLMKIGVRDLVHFDFIDPPAAETLMRALDLLNSLGGLDDEGELTELGNLMAEFPLDPMMTKILVASVDLGCSAQVLTLVSMLSVPYCYQRPRDKQIQADEKLSKFIHEDGDHLTLINVFDKFIANGESPEWCFKNFLSHRNLKSAVSIRSQLEQITLKNNLQIKSLNINSPLYSIAVRKSILAGYFTQVAHKQRSGNYMVVKDNQAVTVHPSCLCEARPPFLVYHELVLTSKNFIRTVSPVKPEWLLLEAPNYFNPANIKNVETRKELEAAEAVLVKSHASNGKK